MLASEQINWLFGRGLSISCGIGWTVPAPWKTLPRLEQIKLIKDALRHEMDSPDVNSAIITKLLSILAKRTGPEWRHQFFTTNWDNLLQREILGLALKELPSWLKTSHVYHLNGTIEQLSDNSNRSPFLLEEDPTSQRCFTPEANIAYNSMIWDRAFIVVGMSFECETDKFLLHTLGRVEDNLPIGESLWIVVNRNQRTLDLCCSRISAALPRAKIIGVCSEFQEWVDDGLLELQHHGVIA